MASTGPVYKFAPATQHDKLFHSYRNNHKQALKACLEAEQKKPADLELLYWRLRIYHAIESYGDATKLLERLAAEPMPCPDPRILRGITSVYYRVLADSTGAAPVYAPAELVELWSQYYTAARGVVATRKVHAAQMAAGADFEWWGLCAKALLRARHLDKGSSNLFYGFIAFSVLEIEKLSKNIARLPEDKVKELRVTEKLTQAFLQGALRGTLEKKKDSPGKIEDVRHLAAFFQCSRHFPEIALKAADELTSPSSALYKLFDPSKMELVSTVLSIWKENKQDMKTWNFCTETRDGVLFFKPWMHSKGYFDAASLQYLMDAVARMDQPTMVEDFNQMMSPLMAQESPSREAYNVAMQWSSGFGFNEFNLYCTIRKYWAERATLGTCFPDIKPHVEKLSHASLDSFSDFVSEQCDGGPGTLGEVLSALKATYHYWTLKSNMVNEWYASGFEGGVLDPLFETLQNITEEDEDMRPPQLVYMILYLLWKFHMHTAGNEFSTRHTPYSIMVLTLIKQWMEEQFTDVYTMGCYLNAKFGLGPRAFECWESLRIKNVMHSPLSHILFTRLSTTYPADAPITVAGLDAQMHASVWNVSKFYQTSIAMSETTSSRTLSSMLGHKKLYADFVLPQFDLYDKVENDCHLAHRTIDLRRLGRLKGKPAELSQDSRARLSAYFEGRGYQHDSRDASTLLNLEPTDRDSFERSLQPEVLPGTAWVDRMLRIELISDLLWAGEPEFSPAEHRANLLRTSYWYRDARARPGQPARIAQDAAFWNAGTDGMTPAEQEIHRAWGLLEPFAVHLALSAKYPDLAYPVQPKELPKVLAQLQSFLEAKTKVYADYPVPAGTVLDVLFGTPTQAGFFEGVYYLLELVQHIEKMAVHLKKAVKSKGSPAHPLLGAVPVGNVASVSQSARRLAQTIEALARRWSETLRQTAERVSPADVRQIYLHSLPSAEISRRIFSLIGLSPGLDFVKTTLLQSGSALNIIVAMVASWGF